MNVVEEIAAERRRQIEKEGWSTDHDDGHFKGELSLAAACYVLPKIFRYGTLGGLWPFDWEWWKPTNRRRDLIKAAALIVAEIERLDRAADAKQKGTAA